MWKEPRVSMAQEVRRDPQSDGRVRKRGGENRGGRFSRGADSGGEGQTGGEMEYKGISTLKDQYVCILKLGSQ